MNIKQHVEKAVSNNPKKIFLYFEDEEITYEQLNVQINKRANYFISSKIQKGDVVTLFLPNCPEFLYSWLALSKIGAIMVPINTSYKERETEYILNHSGAKIIISSSKYLNIVQKIKGNCNHLKDIISIDNGLGSEIRVLHDLVKDFSTDLKEIEINDDDTACILYTSGTTGDPKGCILPNDFYILSGDKFREINDIKPEDRLLTALPLFHMNAQNYTTMGTIIAGASMILLDRFSVSRFWEQVNKYKPTMFNYIGAILSFLETLPESPIEKKHTITRCYGGGLPKNRSRDLKKEPTFRLLKDMGLQRTPLL